MRVADTPDTANHKTYYSFTKHEARSTKHEADGIAVSRCAPTIKGWHRERSRHDKRERVLAVPFLVIDADLSVEEGIGGGVPGFRLDE